MFRRIKQSILRYIITLKSRVQCKKSDRLLAVNHGTIKRCHIRCPIGMLDMNTFKYFCLFHYGTKSNSTSLRKTFRKFTTQQKTTQKNVLRRLFESTFFCERYVGFDVNDMQTQQEIGWINIMNVLISSFLYPFLKVSRHLRLFLR